MQRGKRAKDEGAGETSVHIGSATSGRNGTSSDAPGGGGGGSGGGGASKSDRMRMGVVIALVCVMGMAYVFRLEDAILGTNQRTLMYRSDTCHPPGLGGCQSVILTNEVDFWYHLGKIGVGRVKAVEDVYTRWLARFNELKRTNGVFTAHPYWYALKDHMSGNRRCAPGELLCLPPNPYRSNQIGRAVTFLAEITEDPTQDGFKVEKDKCLMTDWIEANGLPQLRRVGPWRQLPKTVAVLREIADGKMPDKEAPLKYPIFLKACHITQGIQHGTHFIKSQADFAERFQEHMEWVRNIYTTVSSDNERPWAKEALILYPMVNPGVMIVEGWVHANPRPAELKIEVFWGAGFMGFWLGSHPHTGKGLGASTDRDCTALQGKNGNDSWFCPVAAGAFDLAERAAATLGIDEVRIDVFIHPTDPTGHVINEISLFSGHPGARYYKATMGKAWRYGYDHPNEVAVADGKGGKLPQPYALWKG